MIKKIEATREFLPNESILCGWCYYKDICPLYKHEYMVGNLPANKYLKDSGVKLVNKFAQLDNKKKSYKVKIEEIDEELEKIKAAVIRPESLLIDILWRLFDILQYTQYYI